MFSRWIGASGAASVSPVITCLIPTAAAMSPGVDLGDLLALVGVHHQDAPDPLGAPAADVQHARARLQVAGVDAEVGQLADVGVGGDLERQRGERLGVVGVAHDLALAAPGL